ncbi:MraY family glycosyltransferase [Thiohalorhabdus denitrificans]|nr:glycosyltransferase family 4 protein [Thiohalorhabdus denitrificans]
MDIPNARSSHDVPTPRGGGLAVVAVTLVGLPASTLLVPFSFSSLAALWIGGAAVAAIGWLDDRQDLPARWRLLVHLLAGAWVVAWAGGAPALPLPGLEWDWGVLGSVVLVLFIGWVLNLYNFMDGIDGIAGVEALTVAGTAAVLLGWLGAPGWASVSGLIAAASLGFLLWNWPPAKIFMGDAGSGFLGFALAALAVLTWAEAGLTFWAWLILLGAFIVDASLTLARRMLRGERFYEAHRSHAYQHAARQFGSHQPVTVAVGVINLLWLAPLAWAAAAWPEWGLVVMLTAWAPILIICLYFRAGLRE